MKLYKQIFFKSKSEKIFVLLVSVVINKQQENARVDRQHNFLGGSALRHNECKEHDSSEFSMCKRLVGLAHYLETTWNSWKWTKFGNWLVHYNIFLKTGLYIAIFQTVSNLKT